MKLITWEENYEDPGIMEAYNDKDQLLGTLSYMPVGRHMHFCWQQEKDIVMSPGCLQEVRDKQKELCHRKRKQDVF